MTALHFIRQVCLPSDYQGANSEKITPKPRDLDISYCRRKTRREGTVPGISGSGVKSFPKLQWKPHPMFP